MCNHEASYEGTVEIAAFLAVFTRPLHRDSALAAERARQQPNAFGLDRLTITSPEGTKIAFPVLREVGDSRASHDSESIS